MEFCCRIFTLETPWWFQLLLLPFDEVLFNLFSRRFTTFEMSTNHIWLRLGPVFGAYGQPWALQLQLYTSRTSAQTITQTHIQAACHLKPSYFITAPVTGDLSNFPDCSMGIFQKNIVFKNFSSYKANICLFKWHVTRKTLFFLFIKLLSLFLNMLTIRKYA